MIRTCFFISALWVTVSTYAQQNQYEAISPEAEWEEGEILLANSDVLSGLLRYNDRNGVLSYENGDVSKSFTARSVTGFQVFDHLLKRQRLFYSIDYSNDEHVQKRPYFFEVLHDFGDFAVVSKIDPIEVKEKSTAGGAVGYFNGMGAVLNTPVKTMVITQEETVFFLNNKGGLEEYVKIKHKVKDSSFNLYDGSSTRSKTTDKTLLKKYFLEPGLTEMVQYAVDNKLELEVKEDLVKILNAYRPNDQK